MDVSANIEESGEDCEMEFIPIVRSGGWADIGIRQSMEDVYVCFDNFKRDYGVKNVGDGPNAFYGVYFYDLNFFH